MNVVGRVDMLGKRRELFGTYGPIIMVWTQ